MAGEIVKKAELIRDVAKQAGCTQDVAESVVDALVAQISGCLSKGNIVRLTGLGAFEVRERSARQARNPSTGDTMTIPARKGPVFKAAKALKDAVA